MEIKVNRNTRLQTIFDLGFYEIKVVPMFKDIKPYVLHKEDFEKGKQFEKQKNYSTAMFEDEFASCISFCF